MVRIINNSPTVGDPMALVTLTLPCHYCIEGSDGFPVNQQGSFLKILRLPLFPRPTMH